MGGSNNSKSQPPINLSKKINTISNIAIQNGLSRLMQIGYIQFVEPKIMNFVPIYAKFTLWKKRIWNRINVRRNLARWSQKKSEFIQKRGDEIGLEELGPHIPHVLHQM